MKKILFGLIGLSLFFTACTKDEIDPLSVIYEGYVYDTKTGEPIADANLKITLGDESKSVTTDANGHYSFEKISTGIYPIVVSKDGYMSENADVASSVSSNSSTEEIVINKSYELAPLTEKLTRTVFYANDYNHIKIAAANISFTYKLGYGGTEMYSGTTDANGLISLEGMPYNTSVYFYFDFTKDGIRYKGDFSFNSSSSNNSAMISMFSESGSFGIVSSNIVAPGGGVVRDFSITDDITFKFTQSVDTNNFYVDFNPSHDISWAESNTKLTIAPKSDLINSNEYSMYIRLINEYGNSSIYQNISFITEK